MKYLSIDIESTGLEAEAKIIQFAAVPIDTATREIKEDLSFFTHVKCPSFEELSPSLSPWVTQNNEGLIRTAHKEGVEINVFKSNLKEYLNSAEVKSYFGNGKIVLFGKSLSAIDLPFLTRDLSLEFMREHFSHRNADLSSIGFGFRDAGILPPDLDPGSSSLMKFFKMGEVSHTALEDAVNTAKLYFKMLDLK